MRDERICLAAEIKKKEEREDRERGQWEGGETDDPALWDSGLCLGGGGQSVSACRTSPDTTLSIALCLYVCVYVCVPVVKPDLPLIPHTLFHLLPRSLPSVPSGLSPYRRI